jgi:hypothetical protein
VRSYAIWTLKGLRLQQLLIEHLLHEGMKYRDVMRAQQGSNDAGEKKPVAY